MKMRTLNDLFIYQLRDLYSAERQLLQVLPNLAAQIANKELSEYLQHHLQEAKSNFKRLEQCLTLMEVKPHGQLCKAMEGLLQETKGFMELEALPAVKDAGFVAYAQRIKHYEIAAYRTASTYAKYLDHLGVFNLLKQTLSEEKEAEAQFTQIAKTLVRRKIEWQQ